LQGTARDKEELDLAQVFLHVLAYVVDIQTEPDGV